ncbi:MAG: LPS export ABC transporter ATP-binding protein [Pseudomonadota bacterium]|jgi:lipopolysaccharide export system ATP-binding protein
MPEPLTLTAHKLERTVGKRQILREVSLQVKQGEVVALLGPNGAGKTSAFQAIIGLTRLSGGKITLGNEDITLLPMYRRARKGLGYLPQEASIFRGLTVQQNLDAVLEMVCPNHATLETRRSELLNEFGLERVKNSPAPALSGGERRRVEIARALATNPRFLLLDEPFAGVDPLAIADVKLLIQHLKERGMGVLITDHNVRETLAIVDTAYIMAEGRVIASGSPAQIAANSAVRKVYLGEDFRLN